MNGQIASLCHSADAVLEELLEELTVRIQSGEVVDLQQCSAAHPEYAAHLQHLLPAMQALVAFGRSQPTETAGNGTPLLTPALETGVLGDFRIIREIGRGGMGVVYEAEQISIGRRVALKVLPFASMLDERRLARFRNEVRAAGQLHHTNIVPIYAVGSDRGVHFFAMQLVAGQTLAEITTEMRGERRSSGVVPVPPGSAGAATTNDDTVRAALSTVRAKDSAAFYRAVAQLGVQAAEALEHAHSCGVIHRDIKPSNLLLDQRGCLWLTDFGLASIESGADLTMSGDLLGTLRYMSPEQTLGSRVVLDHRTDIYSLGVTIYELLTLNPAFEGTNRGELLRQIAVVEPRALRRIDPTIPADLETIVLKAMSKDASSRYATARHMADDLRRFLENRPIEARRPSLVERGRKWAIRHVTLIAIAAVALAVVAAAGGIATFVTIRAYRSEARQRAAADANLAIASQSIDRLLSRVADEHYWNGDLKEAEKLASDATEFYEELLEHNMDSDLQFRAAQAQGHVAHIWELVGRHEKAGTANRRASQLLERLTNSFPGEPKYLAALADSYNRTGLIDWSLDRPAAAERPWRKSWEIWNELADRFPKEPSYQNSVANMLANLGCVCYLTNRFTEAEEYYKRSDAIKKQLPDEIKNSAEGLASEAGSYTNRAQLARLRGQNDRALVLLDQAIPLHKQSLAKWPTNPVALDCYFETRWTIVECNLGLNRHAVAAAAVEALVETFPDRLDAYYEGAAQLLRCAALADKCSFHLKGGTERGISDAAPSEPQASPNAGSDGGSPSRIYRKRAHELIVKAYDAPHRTVDSVIDFVHFLLLCDDETFRNPVRALDLANSAVKDSPKSSDAWFALALAYYRNNRWQTADNALQKAIKFSSSPNTRADYWLLQAMICFQQRRIDEAQQWKTKADDWFAENQSPNDQLLVLAAEAKALIAAADSRFQAIKPIPHH